MKTILAGITLLFIWGCSSSPNVDQVTKTVPSYSAQDFFKTTDFRGASFSFDESKLLLSNNTSGVFNAHAIPFKGGKMTPLTQSKKSMIQTLSYFPKDDRFLYKADQEGNELHHIYVMDSSGKKRDLTPGNKHKADWYGWNHAKDAFFIGTNERNPKFFDIYKYSAKSYKRQMIYKNIKGFVPGRISKDGRWLALSKVNSNADANIFLVDLKDSKKSTQLITPHKGFAYNTPLTFTPDGKELLYSTDAKGEFAQAWSYNLKTKDHQLYLKRDWDITRIYFSEKGRYRVTSINQDAQTTLEIWDTQKKQLVKLPQWSGNVVSASFSPSEAKMALYINSDTSPSNLFTLKMSDMTAQQITKSLSPSVKETDLAPGKVVRYKSFDGLEIPSILYRPWQASATNQVPAIVYVHGGPGGQSRKGYNPAVQHLVNHGYAVLLVNNRGSSGYGKTFFHLDDKKHGTVDLKDCIWGRKYLEKQPWIQNDKVAIMGGSYGGYMVAAALAFQPDAFNLGIDIFGVTNWLRTLKSIPSHWEAMRSYLTAELGDPKTDSKALIAKSPLFHAEKIRKPLLVVQGANDPRVLQAESDEIVAKVKANGVPVEYLLFSDEGHGFRKTANRISASESYLKFLNKHL